MCGRGCCRRERSDGPIRWLQTQQCVASFGVAVIDGDDVFEATPLFGGIVPGGKSSQQHPRFDQRRIRFDQRIEYLARDYAFSAVDRVNGILEHSHFDPLLVR